MRNFSLSVAAAAALLLSVSTGASPTRLDSSRESFLPPAAPHAGWQSAAVTDHPRFAASSWLQEAAGPPPPQGPHPKRPPIPTPRRRQPVEQGNQGGGSQPSPSSSRVNGPQQETQQQQTGENAGGNQQQEANQQQEGSQQQEEGGGAPPEPQGYNAPSSVRSHQPLRQQPPHPHMEELSEEGGHFQQQPEGNQGDGQPSPPPSPYPDPSSPPSPASEESKEEDPEDDEERRLYAEASKRPEDMARYFSNVETKQTFDKLSISLNFEIDIDRYVNSEDGKKLLNCIKLGPHPPDKWIVAAVCNSLEKKARDACVGHAVPIAHTLKAIKRVCTTGLFTDCLKLMSFPLTHPFFTVFDERSGFGLVTFNNEWNRLFHQGPKSDRTLTDFDKLYAGEAVSVFYGSVLNESERLRAKEKRRAESRFSSRKTKEEAVRAYATRGLLALAQPPQLEDLLIRVLIDWLSFESCDNSSKSFFTDEEGKNHQVSNEELRFRALAYAIGRAVRASSSGSDRVAAHNFALLSLYLGSFPRFEAIGSVIKGHLTNIPSFQDHVPNAVREALLDWIQQKTATVAYAYLKTRNRKDGSFMRFLKNNRLLRRALISYASVVLKMGMPFLRDTLKRARKNMQASQPLRILPEFYYTVSDLLWIEEVRVRARELIFTGDPGGADVTAKLAADMLKDTLETDIKKELKMQKKREKEQKKKKKEDKKQEQQQEGAGPRRTPKWMFWRKPDKKGGGRGGGGVGLLELHHSRYQLTASRSAVGLKRHSPWALVAAKSTPTVFIQSRITFPPRTRGVIAIVVGVLGYIAFGLAVALGAPWAALAFLVIVAIIEFSLFR
ncbi:hypothetical protein Efla_004768 [Eimeria flavescens]